MRWTSVTPRVTSTRFVIISGDSDFSPLVSKLRENAKTVIGVGVKNSTSDLFINNCDEFIYYDDLVRKQPSKSRRRSAMPPLAPAQAPAAHAGSSAAGASAQGNHGVGWTGAGGAGSAADSAGNTTASPSEAGTASNRGPDLNDALELVVETLDALLEERGESESIWGSMIKQAIKRRHPGFNERAYGFRSFNDLLAEAQKRGLLSLQADEKSGGFTVRPADKRAVNA